MEDEVIDNPETTEGEPSEITEEIEGAESSIEEQEETTADPAADTEKEKKGIQKRIDQITREKHEARADAEYWRKVATGEITPHQAQPQPVQQSEQGKPTVEQFETYEDYVEALADYRFDQREAAKQTAERAKTVDDSHLSRLTAAKTQYADFDEVTAVLDDITVANATIEAIKESDVSAELFYYLGQNLDEAKKLQGLSVPAQLKEIGRIEARLERKPVPANRISKAPTPIKPGGASDSVTPQKDPAKMTDDEWIIWERERVKKLGRPY